MGDERCRLAASLHPLLFVPSHERVKWRAGKNHLELLLEQISYFTIKSVYFETFKKELVLFIALMGTRLSFLLFLWSAS